MEEVVKKRKSRDGRPVGAKTKLAHFGVLDPTPLLGTMRKMLANEESDRESRAVMNERVMFAKDQEKWYERYYAMEKLHQETEAVVIQMYFKERVKVQIKRVSERTSRVALAKAKRLAEAAKETSAEPKPASPVDVVEEVEKTRLEELLD